MCTYREVLLHNVKVEEPDSQPHYEREHGDADYEGHEVSAESVGKLLDGRLRSVREKMMSRPDVKN